MNIVGSSMQPRGSHHEYYWSSTDIKRWPSWILLALHSHQGISIMNIIVPPLPPRGVLLEYRWLCIAIKGLPITKTRLYNFDPLKPHFYIVKLGFTGVYIIFLISAQNIDCGYSLEPPRWGGSNEYPQSMFWAEIWKKYQIFHLKMFRIWRWNFLYIWKGVFS